MIFLWIILIFIEVMERKTHINPTKILTSSNHLLKQGCYGLKLLTNLKLTKDQLISLERLLTKKIKSLNTSSKKYKFWVFISLNKTLTKQPLESRMGKGKGSILTEVIFLRKGTIIYEFTNINYQQIKQLFSFFKRYLPAKLLLVVKK